MSFSCAAVILFVNYLHLKFALSNVPSGVGGHRGDRRGDSLE